MLFDKLLNALKLKEPEDNNFDISTTADTPLQESDIPITTDAIASSPENEERSAEETVPVLILQSQPPSNIPIQATPTENTDLNTTEQMPPSNCNLECESLMKPENNFKPQPDVSIVSNDVYYSYDKNITCSYLEKPIIGTIVSFTICNDEEHIYFA